MRGRMIGAAIGLAALAAPALAEPPREADRAALRAAWHRCVREAFSARPARLDRRAAELAALRACKASEDATVAAELAARQAEDEALQRGSLASRARTWMSSVAAYVVDPVAGFLSGVGR